VAITTYVLKDGQPQPCDDRHEWDRFVADFWNRLVADEFVGDYEILTMFAGIDLAPIAKAPPALWETHVQLGPKTLLHDFYRSYRSLEEALNGHAAVVFEVANLSKPIKGNC
jgi:hypothetical protein